MSFKFVSADNILMPDNPSEIAKEYAVYVANEYKNSDKHIGTAESCTGGLLAKLLTDVSGSSNFYECGVVSYSSRIKSKILGVNPETINKFNVVSAEVAAEMAECVIKTADSDVGIGITGVAGPGADGDKPEGEIYVALSTGKDTFVVQLETHTHNKRDYNRYTAALNALNLLLMYIKNEIN